MRVRLTKDKSWETETEEVSEQDLVAAAREALIALRDFYRDSSYDKAQLQQNRIWSALDEVKRAVDL